MSRIETKTEFNELSQAGKLGNYLRIWRTLDDLQQSGYRGHVCIRAVAKQSPWFVPAVLVDEVNHALDNIHQSGGPGTSGFFFQEIPPPDLMRNCNIEAHWSSTGLYLIRETGTTNPLRGIAERGAVLTGLRAARALDGLWPASLEMLTDIWSKYPTAIIEATEFSRPVGAMNKHLVVWEVRDY